MPKLVSWDPCNRLLHLRLSVCELNTHFDDWIILENTIWVVSNKIENYISFHNFCECSHLVSLIKIILLYFTHLFPSYLNTEWINRYICNNVHGILQSKYLTKVAVYLHVSYNKTTVVDSEPYIYLLSSVLYFRVSVKHFKLLLVARRANSTYWS